MLQYSLIIQITVKQYLPSNFKMLRVVVSFTYGDLLASFRSGKSKCFIMWFFLSQKN